MISLYVRLSLLPRTPYNNVENNSSVEDEGTYSSGRVFLQDSQVKCCIASGCARAPASGIFREVRHRQLSRRGILGTRVAYRRNSFQCPVLSKSLPLHTWVIRLSEPAEVIPSSKQIRGRKRSRRRGKQQYGKIVARDAIVSPGIICEVERFPRCNVGSTGRSCDGSRARSVARIVRGRGVDGSQQRGEEKRSGLDETHSVQLDKE